MSTNNNLKGALNKEREKGGDMTRPKLYSQKAYWLANW